jgi:UDP-N-acetylmuramyl pentapeptide phosphotransferase/UDP-N-acetylglucosamine-1-phosphate transferase
VLDSPSPASHHKMPSRAHVSAPHDSRSERGYAKRAVRKPARASVIIAAALLVIAVVGGILLDRAPRVYPHIIIQVADSVHVNFLHHAQRNEAVCAALVDRVAQAALRRCSECAVIEARCLNRLTPRQRNMLNGRPLDIPAVHIPGGIIGFDSSSSPVALQMCMETERHATSAVRAPTRCIAATEELSKIPVVATNSRSAGAIPTGQALVAILLLAAILSFAACAVLIYSQRWHARYTHDYTRSGPQKFHAKPTPRIGGIPIALGLAASTFILGRLEWMSPFAAYGVGLLALAAVPAFAGGLAEDLTKRVGVLARLILTFCAAMIASLLLGATVERTGIAYFDYVLAWPIVALAFTVLVVGGIANAVNLIDGYNGLAAGYAVLALMAIAWVSGQVGDQLVLAASLAMLGALCGFLVWNYPGGRIFLGDGGAYLVGFWLAELCILLVMRNSEVSPWFAALILTYPLVETLFTIYRRRFLKGLSPGHPDALHFHQLIYRRLARGKTGSRASRDLLRRNNSVAPYIWAGTGILTGIGALIWSHTLLLTISMAVFMAAYVWLYMRLLRRRPPLWFVLLARR